MSYILDALKRADAERARGTVPGLHAQSVATAARDASAPRTRLWWLSAAVPALAATAGGVVLLRAPAGSDSLHAAAPVRAERPAPLPAPLPAAAPQDAASAASVPAPALPNPAGVPIAPAALPPPPTVNPSARVAEEARAVAQVPAAPPLTATGAGAVRKAGLTTPLPPVAASAPAKTPESRSSGASAPLRSELPENVRREIPPLTITGAVDSANPAQRLLLVNGQILPQGGSPAPEVTILEIKAQSSLFSFRGTPFRVLH